MIQFSASELRLSSPYYVFHYCSDTTELPIGAFSSKRAAISRAYYALSGSTIASCVIDIRTGMVIWYKERK